MFKSILKAYIFWGILLASSFQPYLSLFSSLIVPFITLTLILMLSSLTFSTESNVLVKGRWDYYYSFVYEISSFIKVTYQFSVTLSSFVSILPILFVSIYFGRDRWNQVIVSKQWKPYSTLYKFLTLRKNNNNKEKKKH